MTFKEKVRSMTGKEIVTAMINGLKKRHVEIDMATYGDYHEQICYGCAATNTICEISGIKFNNADIMGVHHRAKKLDNEAGDHDINFLSGFEIAINLLRLGDINTYNEIAKEIQVAKLPEPTETLLPLNQEDWEINLYKYELYRDTL